MAKIYAAPTEIGKNPELFDFPVRKTVNGVEIDSYDFDAYGKAEEEYTAKLIKWAKKNGSGECAGEVIRFPVADNYARYIVFSAARAQLIHLAIGDGYNFPYVNRLTAKDIKTEVARARGFSKLFAAKK